MKTPFNYLFTALFLFLLNQGFSNIHKNDSLKKDEDADSLICLEINGKIYTNSAAADEFYTAELIEDNTVIQTKTKKDKKAFKFKLEKDKYYAIRILKEGFAPKLISICTRIPDTKFKNEYYSFSFKTELLPEEEFRKLDEDAQDFPIAIVAFDKQKKVFDYNEKYTWNIKKCLFKGTASR